MRSNKNNLHIFGPGDMYPCGTSHQSGNSIEWDPIVPGISYNQLCDDPTHLEFFTLGDNLSFGCAS